MQIIQTNTHALEFSAAGGIQYNNGNGRLSMKFTGTSAQSILLAGNATNATPAGLNLYHLTIADGASVTIVDAADYDVNIYGDLTLEGSASLIILLEHTQRPVKSSSTAQIP